MAAARTTDPAPAAENGEIGQGDQGAEQCRARARQQLSPQADQADRGREQSHAPRGRADEPADREDDAEHGRDGQVHEVLAETVRAREPRHHRADDRGDRAHHRTRGVAPCQPRRQPWRGPDDRDGDDDEGHAEGEAGQPWQLPPAVGGDHPQQPAGAHDEHAHERHHHPRRHPQT